VVGTSGPPFVPHQEINALHDEPPECVVTRSGQEPIVVEPGHRLGDRA
jgi:uncharacterized RmlC-like cupin family protein